MFLMVKPLRLASRHLASKRLTHASSRPDFHTTARCFQSRAQSETFPIMPDQGDTAEGRVYFEVPYCEKDEAKAMGARWDRHTKLWYAHCSQVSGQMVTRWQQRLQRPSNHAPSTPSPPKPLRLPSPSSIEQNASASSNQLRQASVRAVQGSSSDCRRFDFMVPFSDKDVAKRLGAHWDPVVRLWYASDATVAEAMRQRWRPAVRDINSCTDVQSSPSHSSAAGTAGGLCAHAEYDDFEGSLITRYYVNVPYGAHKVAKMIGATFDGLAKMWYMDRFDVHGINRASSQGWEEVNLTPPGLEEEDRSYGGNKLYVDLIPKTAWFKNVRSMVYEPEWHRLRLHVYFRARHCCEACGVNTRDPQNRTRMEAHERFSYDETTGMQTLRRLVGLCRECHEATHMGLAQARGRGGEAAAHLQRVTGMSDDEVAKHVTAAFHLWQRRSAQDWTCDISMLTNAGVACVDPNEEVYDDS
jgi:Domain of unknown function (DUF5710)